MTKDTHTAITSIAQKVSNRTELWATLIETLHLQVICEVGVFKGTFTEALLSKCPSIQRYYMIDSWRYLERWQKPCNIDDQAFEQAYQEAVEATNAYASKRIILRDLSIHALKKIQDESLDMGYIDGDHTLRGITIDLMHILPKIKKGGIIGGDDFVQNIWQHGKAYSPSEVFPYVLYFAEAVGIPVITLPFDQFCLINDREHGFEVLDMYGYAQCTPAEIYWPPPDE